MTQHRRRLLQQRVRLRAVRSCNVTCFIDKNAQTLSLLSLTQAARHMHAGTRFKHDRMSRNVAALFIVQYLSKVALST
jgi:hypothetical protein